MNKLYDSQSTGSSSQTGTTDTRVTAQRRNVSWVRRRFILNELDIKDNLVSNWLPGSRYPGGDDSTVGSFLGAGVFGRSFDTALGIALMIVYWFLSIVLVIAGHLGALLLGVLLAPLAIWQTSSVVWMLRHFRTTTKPHEYFPSYYERTEKSNQSASGDQIHNS